MQDFQAFTVRYKGQTNVLRSSVGVTFAFDPTILKQGRPTPTDIPAIWDTGASCTVISKEYAQKIGLVPTGKTIITGVNNSTEENTYLVNIYLPNRASIVFVKIAEVPALFGGAGILVGMDIIGMGDFSVSLENGKTIMSYRIPSIGGVDYVREGESIMHQKTVLQQTGKNKKKNSISKKEKKKRKMQRKMNKKKH